MIVVTGASGLVGTHLIALLAQQDDGQEIIGIYNTTIPKATYRNVRYVSCDLMDIQSLCDIMAHAKQVYHCAAIVSFDGKDAAALININVEMTANVVNACLSTNIQKLVYISSIAAIGRDQKISGGAEPALLHEDLYGIDAKKSSAYAISKHYAEMEVWRGMAEGLTIAILNPGIILGEGDWEKSSSKLMHTVANGLKWYTKGITGYVDVQDVATMSVLLMNSDIHSARFIAVAGNYSYKFIFDSMAQALDVPAPSTYGTPFMSNLLWRVLKLKGMLTGVSPLITKETARTAHAVYEFDNSKFLKYFPGFKYTPIETTIHRMATAYRADFPILS